MLGRLKQLYRYTPLFGIVVAIGSGLWAWRVFFPSVGEGGDAAGRGMASGFALLGFSAFFLVYLSVLLPSLVLFQRGTGSPRLVAFLNALLLVPALVALGALALDVVVALDEGGAGRSRYEHFVETATTAEYRAPSGSFSFRYGSSPDGIFLVEDGDAVVVFERNAIYSDHRRLVGGARVRHLSAPSGDTAERLRVEYAALTGEPCAFAPAHGHPLAQFASSRYRVYTVPDDDPNDVCADAYARRLNRESSGWKSLYVIVAEDDPDLALEVVLEEETDVYTGPVEDNTPNGVRVEWYDTIRFEP